MFKRIAQAVAFIAALVMLTFFGLASAGAAVTGSVYTDYLAGYATHANGTRHFDDVRATLTLPSQAEASPAVPENTVVVGIAQQQSEVAQSRTFGIGWVWDSTAEVDGVNCGTTAWELEYTDGSYYENPGVPVPAGSLTPVQNFDPVKQTYGPVCMNSGTSYLDLAYSSVHHTEKFNSGVAWNNDTVDAELHVGYQSQLVAGVGLDSGNGTATADLNNGTIVSAVNARITTRLGLNRALPAFNLLEYQGTEFGGAPSVANPLTLSTSAITKSGAFAVVAP